MCWSCTDTGQEPRFGHRAALSVLGCWIILDRSSPSRGGASADCHQFSCGQGSCMEPRKLGIIFFYYWKVGPITTGGQNSAAQARRTVKRTFVGISFTNWQHTEKNCNARHTHKIMVKTEFMLKDKCYGMEEIH